MGTHAVANYNKPDTRQPRFPEIKLHISTVKQSTTLGERLCVLRAQKGLTAESLAKQAGVNEMTIYNWGSGRTQPMLLELGRVAKVLDIDVENLLNKGEFTWGHEIRIQRIKLGYTQKETATMIGVTRSTLGDWERNQYRPSEKMQRKLKNVLSTKFE